METVPIGFPDGVRAAPIRALTLAGFYSKMKSAVGEYPMLMLLCLDLRIAVSRNARC
jgi:hypothetical protein